ncbi:hypothetical protein Acr_01g0004910 [Actinidia rufa]|uniref:Uncharacterized protein n=1 Tax=Actinidia rufa TaxID=165716 RepID=A0A7J0E362_9ERIC|nr:hypothetical protein Acr_01g0004910 [Actinidia rufa]
MPPHQAKSCVRSLTGARGARVAHGARGNRDEGYDNNHQELVMGGEANVACENVWDVGGAIPMVEMLVPTRVVDTRADIRECLNETRRITNPKSQREGTSSRPKGHFFEEIEKFYVTAAVSC